MRFDEWEDRWDFEANSLPLDFANSAEWHAAPEPVEKLNTYEDLVGWSWAAGLLSGEQAKQFLDEAGRRPDEAADALKGAIALREAVFRLFSGLAGGRGAPSEALTVINTAIPEAFSNAHIVTSASGFEWGWSQEHPDLTAMLWPILRAAAALLTSDDLDRVGECADDRGCGYLFFDTSRNRSRRWCSMDSCGNRAKARRHYRRSKS